MNRKQLNSITSGLAIGILALVASSCGQASQSSPQPVLQLGSFAPYVAKFEADSVAQGHPVQVTNLIVQFGAMDFSAERGDCTISGDLTPVITLDETYWNSTDEPGREALIFHELGHCVLRRVHMNSLNQDGIPLSDMNAYTLDSVTYQHFRSQYLAELFSVENQF